jgi:hypothetical protein
VRFDSAATRRRVRGGNLVAVHVAADLSTAALPVDGR